MREGGPVRRADLDYRDISPELQRIGGPYTFAAGIAVYGKHAALQHRQQSVPDAGRSGHRSPPGKAGQLWYLTLS